MDEPDGKSEAFVEIHGRLAYVNVTPISCADTGTQVEVKFFIKNENNKRLILINTVIKELKGKWKLINASKSFSCTEGVCQLCLFLLRFTADSDGKIYMERASSNACLYIIKNLKSVITNKFMWKICPQINVGFIKVWIINGPSLLICNLKNRKMDLISFTDCNLQICQSSTHVTNNCSYDADDRVWLSASLQSYDFQDSRMEYFVILKTSLPQQASNKTDFKFFLITVLINNVVCQRCYSSVPTSISVHLQSSEMIPSCYNGCALSVHQSGIKEFVLDQNRRFILITKIGQVIHCLNGKVKDVCDIPNIGQCGISCCQWEDILLVLHDRDSKTAFIINFKKFKIVKTASNISYVIIGDFLQSGQSQILLIKEKFEFGQESDDFVLLKSYSDLRCTSSPTSSGTNSIVMYEESDDALSSNADIFSGPMETETASESFDSCIKSRVCTALQHNIMGQVALLQERKDTLLYKSTSFSQLLKLIVRLSNNTDKCLDDFKEVVPALVDLTPANNVKEVTEFCSNMECNGLSILQLFQRFLNDNVHVCAMIKNTTARNISQLAMHICGGFESSQFQIDTLNVAIIYEPSYFESPNPCSAFQSKTCVLPNEIVWVTGRFKICSKLLSRVMRGTAFLVKLSYVIRNCDTDRVVMSKIGELPFHHTLNDSKEINSIFTSTESKLVESAINFLNCIHVCKFKHRVYTKCHSVKILDDVLSNNLCFITFNKKNIWICKERGPLFLVRIVLTYQSETSTYMEIQCENKEQNDRLLFALNTYLPADFLFEHEL